MTLTAAPPLAPPKTAHGLKEMSRCDGRKEYLCLCGEVVEDADSEVAEARFRHHVESARWHGKLDPRPLLKVVIGFLVLALIVSGLAWAVVNCYGYDVTHKTKVADKRHDIDRYDHCHRRDEETNRCYDWHMHEDHTYRLILEDGRWETVYEGKYNAYKVGDEYIYVTHHVACG